MEECPPTSFIYQICYIFSAFLLLTPKSRRGIDKPVNVPYLMVWGPREDHIVNCEYKTPHIHHLTETGSFRPRESKETYSI